MPLHDFRSRHLPYVLKKVDNGYIVLNRDYKPLGFGPGGYKYEDYPIAVRFKGLTKKIVQQLSSKGSDAMDSIYLYDDKTIPTKAKANMDAYLKRLAILAKLKFKEER